MATRNLQDLKRADEKCIRLRMGVFCEILFLCKTKDCLVNSACPIWHLAVELECEMTIHSLIFIENDVVGMRKVDCDSYGVWIANNMGKRHSTYLGRSLVCRVKMTWV